MIVSRCADHRASNKFRIADVFLGSSFVQPMTQVTSIRVEISNHPSKMSFTKERRKHKKAAVNINNRKHKKQKTQKTQKNTKKTKKTAVNIHNFTTFNAVMSLCVLWHSM